MCPAVLFLRGKVVAGIIHTRIYFVALVTLIFGVGIAFWMVGIGHAWWAHVKQEQLIQRQATVIAEKMTAQKQSIG